MTVSISWTWHCLSDGRTTCPAGCDGTAGLNRHVAETLHGVFTRGVPVK